MHFLQRHAGIPGRKGRVPANGRRERQRRSAVQLDFRTKQPSLKRNAPEPLFQQTDERALEGVLHPRQVRQLLPPGETSASIRIHKLQGGLENGPDECPGTAGSRRSASAAFAKPRVDRVEESPEPEGRRRGCLRERRDQRGRQPDQPRHGEQRLGQLRGIPREEEEEEATTSKDAVTAGIRGQGPDRQLRNR